MYKRVRLLRLQDLYLVSRMRNDEVCYFILLLALICFRFTSIILGIINMTSDFLCTVDDKLISREYIKAQFFLRLGYQSQDPCDDKFTRSKYCKVISIDTFLSGRHHPR